MKLDLKFFYFANQCPHNCYLLARIKTLAWQERVKLHLFDVAGDEETCAKYRIFSPTLLIVNDKYRVHGPFTNERVMALLEEEDVGPRPYRVAQGDQVVRWDLIPIDGRSVLRTGPTCAGAEDEGLCMGKSEWVSDMLAKAGVRHLGYLHLKDGRCVGGAEFLPSKMVPYPIAGKDQTTAFLSCSYLSDEKADFRTHPLERLIEDLRAWGYRRLSVVSATDGVFPNGPSAWFEKKGFEDKGTLIREEMHDAELHLMQLQL